MVVVVGAIYAPIAPPVVAAVALYFAGAELVYAHQFLCVSSRYETGGSGGRTWRGFFLALAVGQATLAGQLLILEAPEAAAALAPLLLLTLKAGAASAKTTRARFLDRESSVRFGLYSRRAAHHAALAARSLSLSFSCDLDGDDDRRRRPAARDWREARGGLRSSPRSPRRRSFWTGTRGPEARCSAHKRKKKGDEMPKGRRA
ncbi:hypothetical protein JL722_10632 [Aureococcus anophagefferens]|nr:hypothetical protein JL722_10632 [Aureococcus anophagefferens]